VNLDKYPNEYSPLIKYFHFGSIWFANGLIMRILKYEYGCYYFDVLIDKMALFIDQLPLSIDEITK